MAEGLENVHCSTHLGRWLTLKVGGAYIPATTVRRRLGGMAHLRSSSPFRGFSPGFGRKREASKLSGPPEGGAGGSAAGVCCLKLWIGRKRNVGGGVLADFSSRAKAHGERSNETSAVLRFGSSSFVRSRLAQAGRDRRAWDSSNVVIEPIRISNLRV